MTVACLLPLKGSHGEEAHMSHPKTGRPALFLAGFVLATTGLFAEETAPASSRWEAETKETLGAGVNPLGLQNAVERTWRRLLTSSANPLLSDAHLAFGLSQTLTPAYGRFGAWAEVAPLTILEVRAGIEPVGYFGTFSSLLPFDSYDARFDDATRKARSKEAAPALAERAYAAPTLKLKFGPVIARAHGELSWWRAGIHGPFFYEPSLDTILKAAGDSLMATDAELLYEVSARDGHRVLVGPVHELTRVFKAPENRREDVGALGVVGLGSRFLGAGTPTLLAKVVYFLDDPHRRHALGAQAALSLTLGGGR
jgi:hypothetical protein